MAHRTVALKENQPKIVVSKYGEVIAEEIDSIIKVMRECYDRLAPHQVSLLDLYVFERFSTIDAFTAKEREEVGVLSDRFDDLFFAMHDAWRGTPRITVCLERMKKLPKLVLLGGIRHEVGHSVLHGSILYYLLPLQSSPSLPYFDVSPQYDTNLLYLISLTVKDYEVSRLLYERGYVDDLIAYAKHLLTITESDILSWEMSIGKPLYEILFLVSSLKALGCAAPLLNKGFGEEMNRRVSDSISYLPRDYSELLIGMLESFSSLGSDTLNNIDQMTLLIKEKIVKPLSRREAESSHNT